MLKAVCLLQTTELTAHSFHWKYSTTTPPDRFIFSSFPLKGAFIKTKTLRVVSFTGYIQISSPRHADFFSKNELEESRLVSLTDWQLTFSPRSETVCFIFVHLCILWFLYWCKRKKKEEMKGHCWSRHHNKQSNVAFVNLFNHSLNLPYAWVTAIFQIYSVSGCKIPQSATIL